MSPVKRSPRYPPGDEPKISNDERRQLTSKSKLTDPEFHKLLEDRNRAHRKMKQMTESGDLESAQSAIGTVLEETPLLDNIAKHGQKFHKKGKKKGAYGPLGRLVRRTVRAQLKKGIMPKQITPSYLWKSFRTNCPNGFEFHGDVTEERDYFSATMKLKIDESMAGVNIDGYDEAVTYKRFKNIVSEVRTELGLNKTQASKKIPG